MRQALSHFFPFIYKVHVGLEAIQGLSKFLIPYWNIIMDFQISLLFIMYYLLTKFIITQVWILFDSHDHDMS